LRRLDSSLTLKPAVFQVAVERQVVRAKVLAVVSLFPVAAEQDPVEVVERQRRDVGLELRALDHAHATSTERLHPVAELRQQLPDRDQCRLDGRTQRHAANHSQQTQCTDHSLANWDSCPTPAKNEAIEYLQSWTHRN